MWNRNYDTNEPGLFHVEFNPSLGGAGWLGIWGKEGSLTSVWFDKSVGTTGPANQR